MTINLLLHLPLNLAFLMVTTLVRRVGENQAVVADSPSLPLNEESLLLAVRAHNIPDNFGRLTLEHVHHRYLQDRLEL